MPRTSRRSHLQAAGVEVAAIADLRAAASGSWAEAAKRAGIEVLAGVAVSGTQGGRRVSGITIAGRRIDCDLVLMSGGHAPSVHLFSQSRGRLTWSDAARCFFPLQSAERERSAGACRGIYGLSSALADGAAAGCAAAQACGLAATTRRYEVAGEAVSREAPGAAPRDSLDRGGKAFVDFQNDVTTRDLELAAQEGFHSIEHVKRYTTAGMATDQGKTSNRPARRSRSTPGCAGPGGGRCGCASWARRS